MLKKLCEFSTVWAEWADWADLGRTEIVLQTDSNFPSKGQFLISIFNNKPKLEKVGVTPIKTKKPKTHEKKIEMYSFKSCAAI